MYRFPTDPARKAAWVSQIGKPHWEPRHTWRVCSEHFDISCYEHKRQDGWHRLKLTAVPTLLSSRASSAMCKSASPSSKEAALQQFKSEKMSFEETALQNFKGEKMSFEETAVQEFKSDEMNLKKAALQHFKSDKMSLKKAALQQFKMEEIDSASLPEKTELWQGTSTESTPINNGTHFHNNLNPHALLNETCIIGLPAITDGSLIRTSTDDTADSEKCSGASAGCNAAAGQCDTSVATSSAPSLKPAPESRSAKTECACCLQLLEVLGDRARKYKNLEKHHEEAKREIWTLKNKLMKAEQQIRTLEKPKLLARNQKKALIQQTSRGVVWTLLTEVTSPS